MNKISTKKRGWRILRRILLVLAVLATLIAALYTEEDWRGKRAWENYRREWEAKGENFDWRAYVPPPGPADRNFFTTAIFSNLLKADTTLATWYSDGSDPQIQPGSGSWAMGTRLDLRAWQSYYRNPANPDVVGEFPRAPQPQTPAADILLALSKYDSKIGALRQAIRLPDARIPLNYEEGFNAIPLQYYSTLKRCYQVLYLRAIAELADGRKAQALDDVNLLLRLDESIRNSPFLIAHLVRLALANLMLQPIWEGLAAHQWSDEQLATLDAGLVKLDYLADYQLAMRGERAFAIQAFENQRLTRQTIEFHEDLGSGKSGYVTNSLYWLPAAFFYQNELSRARLVQQWILPLTDTNTHMVSPKLFRDTDAAVHAMAKYYSPYSIMSLMVLPALDKSVVKFAYAQASMDLARVGCALERYRLAHGDYPPSLAALTPQFLKTVPPDVINGQPLHYHRTADGLFILYSVGWNERDDGGQISTNKNGQLDRNQGDWVWRYPAPVK